MTDRGVSLADALREHGGQGEAAAPERNRPMNASEHYELFRYLNSRYCLLDEDIKFVESVADWCRGHGVEEPDPDKPLRLVPNDDSGCTVVIREQIAEKAIDDRIKALSVRSALINVAVDRARMLDSDRKKLAYLFLSEYAMTLPEVAGDELLADNWAFEEMEEMGFFKV